MDGERGRGRGGGVIGEEGKEKKKENVNFFKPDTKKPGRSVFLLSWR